MADDSEKARSVELTIATVLFADLCDLGSDALRAESDARWRRVVWLESAREVVLRHGAKIDDDVGGRLMAVFGEPAAEDDAQRALDAALELSTAQAAIRVGIDTGIVEFASPLASYLESICPPRAILVSTATYRHARGRTQMRPLPPITIDARREPVVLHEVVKRRRHGVRLSVNGVHRVETDLVGRRDELHRIWGHFRGAIERRTPALVAVTGPAGVGKSRLVRELLPYLDARGEEVSLFAPRTSRRGNYPFIADLLGQAAEVKPGDSPDQARAKLVEHIRRTFTGRRAEDKLLVVTTQQELEHVVRVLCHAAALSGPDLPPPPSVDHPAALYHQTMDALSAYMRAVAVRGPILLLMEDLHTASELSLDILSELLGTPDLPLVAIVTLRSGGGEKVLDRVRGERLMVHLDPLGEEMALGLAEAILRPVRGPTKELARLVASSSGGNPLFMEEITNGLFDAGVLERRGLDWQFAVSVRTLAEVPVPATVEDVVRARIDIRSPNARGILKRAALLGMSFSEESLAALFDEPSRALPFLDELIAHDLVVAEGLVKEGAPRWFRIEHELLRDIALAGVSAEERRRWHMRVADWMIGAMPAKATPAALMALVHHLAEAGDHDRTAQYAAQAGDAARDVRALRDAVQMYRIALAEVDASRHHHPLLRTRLPERLGDALHEIGEHDQAIEAYDRLLMELPDPIDRCRVTVKRGHALESGGKRDAAAGAFRRALADVERAPDGTTRRAVMVDALRSLGWNRHLAGDFYAAGDCYRKGFDVCGKDAETIEAATLHAGMGALARARGVLPLAVRHHEHALEIVQRLGDERREAECLSSLSTALLESGHQDRAVECLRKTIECKDRLGDRAGAQAARAELARLER